MDSFFDFIFGNIFIIVIIVGAIINFLSSAKKQEEKKRQQQRRTSTQQQTRTETNKPTEKEKRIPSLSDLQDQLKEQFETIMDTKTEVEETVVAPQKEKAVERFESVEEQRRKQFERLQKQYQTTMDDDAINSDMKKHLGSKKQQEEAIAVSIQDKLTKDGIVEGLIMSEILGPPRALNPYENIAAKRRRK